MGTTSGLGWIASASTYTTTTRIITDVNKGQPQPCTYSTQYKPKRNGDPHTGILLRLGMIQFREIMIHETQEQKKLLRGGTCSSRQSRVSDNVAVQEGYEQSSRRNTKNGMRLIDGYGPTNVQRGAIRQPHESINLRQPIPVLGQQVMHQIFIRYPNQ